MGQTAAASGWHDRVEHPTNHCCDDYSERNCGSRYGDLVTYQSEHIYLQITPKTPTRSSLFKIVTIEDPVMCDVQKLDI